MTGKSKEDIRLQSSTGGTSLGHVLFEMPGSTRKLRKRCRGCYEVINQNGGSALAAAKLRRVKTVCNKCGGKAYFQHPRRPKSGSCQFLRLKPRIKGNTTLL